MDSRFVVLLLLFVSTSAAGGVSNDLDVGWISRHPEIEYVWNSANPKVEGWPAAGDPVTWRAHVRNWSSEPKTARYEWRLDGDVIASGVAELAADAHSEMDFVRPWSFARHELTFRVDNDNAIAEESEKNNELTIYTNALAVGFWVEESFYRFMRENQQQLAGIGSASFEDWAQRHIRKFNEMAALAIYPETPAGVLDRWRLQKIVIVPDGALPLVPVDPKDGNGSSHPNDADRTVDLSWGLRAVETAFYTPVASIEFNPFYLSGSLIHELGHARYLIDVYGYSVKHVPPQYRIEITENGVPVVNGLMPASPLLFNGMSGYDVYETADSGLMVYDYDWIDRHSAAAMNLIAGARAVSGHANVPQNYAVYLNDLPAENRVTIRDSKGNPFANAPVDLFQGVRANDDLSIGDSYLSRVYDDHPDLHFTTDASGRILVGRNPFTSRGPLDGYREGELTAILRVRSGGKTMFGFLESRVFNLAYWRGERDFADHEVFVGLRCSESRPNLSAPEYLATLDTNRVTLTWRPVANAESYTVWASSGGKPPQVVADSLTATTITATLGGDVRWWVEVHYGVACPARRSLTFAFTAPQLPEAVRHRAVAH